MATIAKDIILQVQNEYGGTPAPRTLKEAASQTFVKGELVHLVDGYITETVNGSYTALFGVAAQDGSNDSSAGDSEVSVYHAAEGIVFAANALEASETDHVLVQSDVGRAMGIQHSTTDSKWYLDTDEATNLRVYTLGIARGSAIGDTNARLLFTFLPTHVQGRSTS